MRSFSAPWFRKEILTTSESDTARLAARVAEGLRAGDVLLLTGAVGAGKSVFARAAIQSRMAAAGEVEDVPSPTYTLIQTYRVDETDFVHCDLYRLSDPSEIDELGLQDALDSAVCLIEWPERMGDHCPDGALSVRLSATGNPDHRRIGFSWSDPRWNDRIKALSRTEDA